MLNELLANDLVGLAAGGVLVTLVGGAYLFQRLYKCPECFHRSDYDHIAEVNEEAPFCPYCGTKTKYVGRKYQAWANRFGLPSDYRVITAEDGDES